MLKVTILTCAIITTPSLLPTAQAGDSTRASLVPSVSMSWTGRFVDVASAPASTWPPVPSPAPAAPVTLAGHSDPDIVGSIPPTTPPDSYTTRVLEHGSQESSLCGLPLAGKRDKTGQDLACNGIADNPWSAKVEHFNYDLSAVDPAWLEPFSPYRHGQADVADATE
jgi:hypothetical protein